MASQSESIIDVSRRFFYEIVLPILQEHFPEETEQTAFGVFGYGSEALRLDDELSRDHHWGLRIDALMPEEVFQQKRQAILETVSAQLPPSYEGYSLREGHVAGAGLAPDSLTGFLTRTLGMDHPPATYAEWLSIPEEDIIHVINGEVWHDPLGKFSAIRAHLRQYYPEPVRLRRIAHWCRYYSGMGTYALKRAILREDWFYATTRFSNALRLGVQLAFLLDRQYFPYDKWLMAFFRRLPRMAGRLLPLVEEAVALSTGWERKLALLDQMSDILDQTLVEDGVIAPHPPFRRHPTSGYRILEHAYAEIIQKLPPEIKTVVPVWDQVYLERFHSGYVDSIPLDEWDRILNLTAPEEA
ncbi:MAG: DUF4037 domain-containing protein [Caldilineae bacterium]|nr:MAG: DUF4037 domain-containing protein [Caldilineae bacterium]